MGQGGSSHALTQVDLEDLQQTCGGKRACAPAAPRPRRPPFSLASPLRPRRGRAGAPRLPGARPLARRRLTDGERGPAQ